MPDKQRLQCIFVGHRIAQLVREYLPFDAGVQSWALSAGRTAVAFPS
jgi:hypothetical protein